MKLLHSPFYAALLFALLPLTISAQTQDSIPKTPNRGKVQATADGLAKQAEFPGGTEIMKAYIRRELKYPEELAKKNMEGRVTLQFMIMPDGSIDSIRPLRTAHPLFTEEAIRVIQSMPWWSPAIDTLGNAVASVCTLPISFQLQSPQTKEQNLQQTTVPPIQQPDSARIIIEQKPSFPGGQAGLMEYIRQNLHYPQNAVKEKIQGRVIVSFFIGTTGEIEEIEVVKSPHKWLSEEAIRLVKKMPKWEPGLKEGEPVRVKYLLPLTFKL